ncbi:MAG TPA: ABC transporter ATP-binding protein [Streptosporangiaceae bacterium]|nr:ABC transporter ATP-binding protein [Streptosporangiaceae bacterium]
MQDLLEVENLQVRLFDRTGPVLAVRGVSLSVGRGEVVALVGESGCGKSVTALSLLRLLPGSAQVSGSIRLDGQDVLELNSRQLRALRGGEIAMVFQEPMTSLNPAFSVGNQIAEVLSLHQGMRGDRARARALELLRMVGIGAPDTRLRSFPHELSGGMRQRVMIAMALAGEPSLLILDEPTTALDVTTQAQILDIVRDLRTRTGAAILLITHDLGVVADLADRVVVMYAGANVEEAGVYELFGAPRHPYAAGLLGALPGSAAGRRDTGSLRLAEIPGIVPTLRAPLESCAFAPRCHSATDLCRRQPPRLAPCGPGDDHAVACFHPEPAATVPA